MATTDEIRHRIQEADAARSAKRAAAAQQVGDLAQRRAAVAEQLEEIERELGDILIAAQDVIDIAELAEFTDVKAADLTRWLTNRKASRPKRKKPATSTPGRTTPGSPAAQTPRTTMPSPSERVPAQVP